MTMGVGAAIMISLVASKPSMRGMWTSIVTTSGRSDWVSATASAPLTASPTTRISGSLRRISARSVRAVAESSTTRTRIMRRSQQLGDGFEQVLLVEGALDEVGVGADLDAA